jgi:AAA+ ATPase superfamily predicted ATPase
MTRTLTGREEQLEQMQQALQSGRPELIALVGRRRVGKTFLIRHAYEGQMAFELTGIQSSTKQEQIQNFFFRLRTHFPNTTIERPPDTWLEAFHILIGHLEQLNSHGPLVVVFDEFPWLSSSRSGFLKGFSYFWNSWASTQNIVVVICGSAASWMIRNVINDRGSLHNRVTRFLQVDPFTLKETESFLHSKDILLDRYQILSLYMALGGIPMYLELVEPGLSAIQNIQNLCFSRTGFLRDEFNRLYPALFDSPERHLEIVRTLASKRIGLTREEIIAATSITNGGTLTRTLQELAQSGFISQHGAFRKKTKDTLYRLTDEYTLFYLTFIEPLGIASHQSFTDLSTLPQWRSWSGFTFESICLRHIDPIRTSLGIAGISSRVSSFRARPVDGLPGTQIDLLIDRNDQTINLCEMKYSTEDFVITKAFIENMQQKKAVFRHHTRTRKHLFTTLITTFGTVDNVHRNSVDQVLDLDDLFS